MRAVTQGFHQLVHISRAQQGLIALDIQIDICLFLPGHFHKAIRTGSASGRGQDGPAAKVFYGLDDAGIIRSYQHRIHQGGFLDSFIDTPDHGLAANIQQGLARQAGRGIPGGNDD
ncbi:hypothetical protein DESPIG_01621 [Desulfovibrio piger ATCC 29098]|uniref:Uncharacterized protein n=1 Tax=Desulfovibrio piger ATCC 29098 TaxID=411464 RepID=B6WU63_9BACT|nr:hypothetical protein DESPIG_01621 [Desulfovibrio piger ATCC 29098]